MKERFFLNEKDLKETTRGRLRDLERSFIEENFLRPELIEETAAAVSEDIEEIASAARTAGEEVSIILHILDARNLIDRIDKEGFGYVLEDRPGATDGLAFVRPGEHSSQAAVLTVQEVENGLAPLRQNILNRLQGSGIAAYAVRLARMEGAVRPLHDGKILKKCRLQREKGIYEDRVAALGKLYRLPRDFHILYTILELDSSASPGSAEQIQAETAFTTLDRHSVNSAIAISARYLADAIQGAAFLAKNGLRLVDLSLNNIAVHEGRGKLFDFDGLYTENLPLYGLLGNQEYPLPPERRAGEKPRPVTEAEMVFELGCSLHDLLLRASPSEQPRADNQYHALAARMTSEEPGERPSLYQAAETLRAIAGISGSAAPLS